MSSESLKFIVESLNSPPFNCNTSLIGFDTWPPNVLLQQLSDVIREEWRAGLVEGAKKSIYPVLVYLFSNSDMLKQRAYLANWITQTANTDISKETPDETALRILYNLKILRFKPPSDIDQ
ncbi:hypothetical protein OSTOST_12458, partial [Ostertagia ostertagi]